MKRINYFAMSLLASAALAFTGCSSEDLVGGETNKNEASNAYYMTLTVVTPQSTGTRTAENNPNNDRVSAKAQETTITNGTIYVYDGENCVFKKSLVATDWVDGNTTNATKPIPVSVNNVTTNKEYQVYFVANTADNYAIKYGDPLAKTSANILDDYATASTANKFIMFNRNDEKLKASHSTVTFTEASKDQNSKVSAGTIYLDRVVARVDAPTVNDPKITKKENTTTTTNIDQIESIEYQGYALANLAKTANLVQTWNEKSDPAWSLAIPNSVDYDKATATYGGSYNDPLKASFNNTDHNYIFENTTSVKENATAIYFQFKVNLKTTARTKYDFPGTFYRYGHKIYTSLEDLYNESLTNVSVSWPFVTATGAVTSADDAIKSITGADGNIDETKVEAMREKFHINVYVGGITYYKAQIDDNNNSYEKYNTWNILRNTIYSMTVNSIYDLGKDVPNGPDPTEEYNYWMDVTVTVNNWVKNDQTVDLQ